MVQLKVINRFKGYWRGQEYPNGKVYIKDFNGNLATSYKEVGGEYENENPILLDANAEADIFLKEGFKGSLRLTDYNDVFIYNKVINGDGEAHGAY